MEQARVSIVQYPLHARASQCLPLCSTTGVCPAGEYAWKFWLTTYCKACPAGKYLLGPHAQTTCSDCEVGRYQPSTGQSSCLPCAGARETGSTDCTATACEPGEAPSSTSSDGPVVEEGKEDTVSDGGGDFKVVEDVSPKDDEAVIDAGGDKPISVDTSTYSSSCSGCTELMKRLLQKNSWSSSFLASSSENRGLSRLLQTQEATAVVHGNDPFRLLLNSDTGPFLQVESMTKSLASSTLVTQWKAPKSTHRRLAACEKCDPGKYGTDGKSCKPCEDGTFSGTEGAKECETWRTCGAGQRVDTRVTPSTSVDRACTECPGGTLQTSPSHTHTTCEAHTGCGAGTRVLSPGTSTSNPTCTSCTGSTWQGSSNFFGKSCAPRSTCPAGTYQTSPGDFKTDRKCEECSEASFSNSENAPACNLCKPSFYGTGVMGARSFEEACAECPPGRSTRGEGMKDEGECEECRAGAYRKAGMSACQQCGDGSYSPAGAASCSACPAGWYGRGDGLGPGYKDACAPCAAGKASTTKGASDASTCTACGTGKWSSEGATTCTACGAGTYRNPASGCQPCPAGQYSGGGRDTCTLCPNGRYRTSTGGKVEGDCTACPAGRYGLGTGKSSLAAGCGACADGAWSASGAASCYDCPPGKYQTSEGCVSCGKGTYQDEPKTLSCKDCPVGRHNTILGRSTLDACYWCPAGRFTGSSTEPYIRSTGRSFCTDCLAGRYRAVDEGGNCIACGNGEYQSSTGATECTACPVGRYHATSQRTALSQCALCAPGKYTGSVRSSTCSSCDPGLFASESGMSTCTLCAAGLYASSGGVAACTECPEGKFMDGLGATTCTSCPSGRYHDGVGSTVCKACPAGRHRDTRLAAHAGATQCYACAPGSFTSREGVHITCSACTPGFHQAEWGQTGCDTCNWGTHSPGSGASLCTDCPAGRYEDSTTSAVIECKTCPKGRKCSGTGLTEAQKCPLGQHQPLTGQTVCKACGVGTYAGSTGLVDCTMCSKGQFQSETGQSLCVDCEGGRYSGTTGQSTCDACPAGKHGGVGLSVCQNCQAGWAQGSTGKSTCVLCGAGKFQGGSGATLCEACAPGTVSGAPVFFISTTWNLACSACEVGKSQPNSEKATCEPCASGKYQPSMGKSECLNCRRGAYMSSTGATACTTCPAGRATHLTGQGTCSTCPTGRYALGAAKGDLSKSYLNSYCMWCGPGTMSLGNTGKSTGILAGAVSEAVPGWSVLGVDGVYDTKHSLATPAVIAASRPPNEAKGLWRLPLSEAAALTSTIHVTPEMDKVMKAVLGGEGCLMCTPGKATSGWSQGSCMNCEPGLYQPGHGHRFCNACPSGKYSAEKTIGGVSRGSTVGATACWDCPAGRMQVMRGMSTCSRCSPGFFSSSAGQEICSPCPAGRFTGGFGATECDRCPAGKSNLVVGQSVCVDCSPGTYAAGSGMKLCTLCSPGTFTDATGVSACSQCGTGKYTSSAGRTECQSCPAGKHSSLMATHSIGASICQDCARGRYSPEAGAEQCTKATPGRYVSGRGQSTTQACPVGRFSREHAAAPSEGALVPPSSVPMPGGVGVPVMDSSVTCEPCHAGKYCDAPGMTLSDAKLCKAGRWGRPGATSPACHGACPAGRMCPDGTAEGASLPCTAGTFCPAGTGATGTRVTSGFYSYDSAGGSASITGGTDQARCPPGHFCVDGKLEKCPAGRYESKFGKTACKNLCSAGFFCPEGSTQDRVQACAAGKDSPQAWYCPEGVTSPMRTSDYTAASSPGQYTPAYEPPTQRTQATSCSGGTSCWGGVQYPRLTFVDDVCKNGFGSITATVPSLVGESTITMEPHTLTVQERMSGPLPTPMSAGLVSFSVGGALSAPGCKASNPFALSSDGVLTMSGAMSPFECFFWAVRVRARASSTTITCDIIVRMQTDEGAIREPAVSIAAGSGHVCYISPPASTTSLGGNLICLASGGDSTREKTLAAPSSLYGWMQVAAGAAHVCGLDAAGIVKCFGRQQVYSRGTEHVWSTPPDWGRARSISAGEDFTCVIAVGVKKEDRMEGAGRLHCVGSNEELGSAWAAAQPSFVDKQIAAVSVGGNAVCAIASSDGSLACFGTSGASRLLANVPTGAFTQVSVGLTGNACGLRRSDSKLLCWGAQWSVGTMEYSAAFSAVAVGEDWICGVLQSSSRLQCYGNIIPRVFASYSNIPTEPVVQVAAGKDMLCVSQSSGLVQCFGRSQVSASAVSRLGEGVLALLPM